MSKIVIADIITLWGGFTVEKITAATDAQLKELEERLCNEIATVQFSNVEELGYLNVAWFQNCPPKSRKNTTNLQQKIAIAKILNQIFYSLVKTI